MVLAVQGRDIKLSVEKLEQSRNFTNKLYNAANYLLMNAESFEDLDRERIKTPLGRYILSRFDMAVAETRNYIEQYRFNDAATTLYRFLWGEFCDWGIELSKASRDSVAELGAIFKESMKLLHPFMPYITEYLYQRLGATTLKESDSIMIREYPVAGEPDEKIMEDFALAIEAIVSIRRCKTLVEKANQRIEKAYLRIEADFDEELMRPFIEKLSKAERVEFVTQKPDPAVTDVSDHLESYISTADIDMTPIIAKLQKQREKLEKEIMKIGGMLKNEKFVANAPEAVVEQNRKALADAEQKLEKIKEELEAMGT